MKSTLMVSALAVAIVGFAGSASMAMHHPTLGRFVQRDPLGYVDGMGLYEYVGGRTTAARDPFGDALVAQFRSEASRRFIESLLQRSNPKARVDPKTGEVTLAEKTEAFCTPASEREPDSDLGLIHGLVEGRHTHYISVISDGRSGTVQDDVEAASDADRGSGTTITVAMNDRTRLERVQADGASELRMSEPFEHLEHEMIHASHADAGRRSPQDQMVSYVDLRGRRRTARNEEVRTLGCTVSPPPGQRPGDVTANDLIRHRNRLAGKTNIDEGVFVGIGG
jgi:hypothetical protein